MNEMTKSLRQKIQESLDRRKISRHRAKQRRLDVGDIAYAVSWAKTHFNVGAPDTALDTPTFDMEVDRDRGEITVWPRLCGKRIATAFPTMFQLCREDNQLIWKGANPFTGTPFMLKVPQQGRRGLDA